MASELEAGTGAWSNIALIVRQTFSLVLEKLRAHGEKLRSLERLVLEERKARREDLETLNAAHQQALSTSAVTGRQGDEEARSRVRALEVEVAELRAKIAELAAAMPRRDEVQRILAKKVDVATLDDVLQNLPDKESLDHVAQEVRTDIEEQFNSFRRKVAEEISKGGDGVPEEFALLKNTVTCELLIGRWLFSLERASEGGLTLRETVNTAQLLYEQIDDSTVRVQRKGIYEVQLGVFSAGPSRVELLVNGEVLLSNDSAGSSKQTVKAGPSGRRISLSSAAIASGSSLHEFILLDAHSELSLRIKGERCQGFLGIRNLFCEPDE
jgi:hypothetical protein